MNIDEAIRGRRSIRMFDKTPIPKEKVEQIVDAAQWAPNSCNKQAWKFVVVTDEKLKEKAAFYAGTSKLVLKSPLFIVVLYHTEISEEHHANYQSAAAAIQNMVLKAYSMNIGTSWMCNAGDRDKLREILGVPKQYRVISIVCMGYYKTNTIKRIPERKDAKELISYNKFEFDTIYPLKHELKHWTYKQAINYFGDSISASSPKPKVYMGRFIGKEIFAQVDWVSKYLKKDDKVLEVFPYAGNFVLHILQKNAKKNLQFSVLDFDERIQSFRDERQDQMKLKDKIETLYCENFKIPVPDNTYDKVCFFENVGSIPGYEKLLAEMQRVLKPGGMMFVSFKNKHSVNYIHNKLIGRSELYPQDLLTTSHVTNVLKPFKVKNIEGISLSPLSLGQRSPYLKKLSRIVCIALEKPAK